ncbi:hypothetical protein [Breznakia blatticola]|uniref:hypothetical protein n=1 Tax=Breznakia blatticola TaxID=1754012 RepID=UPI001066840F|nr:hypothetical protein [Breznakia blatticola]
MKNQKFNILFLISSVCFLLCSVLMLLSDSMVLAICYFVISLSMGTIYQANAKKAKETNNTDKK